MGLWLFPVKTCEHTNHDTIGRKVINYISIEPEFLLFFFFEIFEQIIESTFRHKQPANLALGKFSMR